MSHSELAAARAYLATIGKLGGSSTSPAKRRASAENAIKARKQRQANYRDRKRARE